MGTDVVLTEEGKSPVVVNPASGELVTVGPDTPTTDLAVYLFEVRDHEARLRDAKSLVQHEMLDRMDRRGVWTATVGPWKLKGKSPRHETSYDGETLWKGLLRLVRRKVIDAEARDAAVAKQTTYKVSRAGVNALSAIAAEHPALEQVLEDAKRTKPPDRSVSVQPARIA